MQALFFNIDRSLYDYHVFLCLIVRGYFLPLEIGLCDKTLRGGNTVSNSLSLTSFDLRVVTED